MDEIINVESVSKKYRSFYENNTLKGTFLQKKWNKKEENEILKNISFSVKRGESIGLLGQNGCGKSTLLKLLSRIIYPDSGSIKIKGRVSCLIELGAGFHPDMTGRENIMINASTFGLKRKEILALMDTIIDFSELGDYIDCPVRTYSSGMYMRLAFSIAINVKAEIILIDEILAVGDVAFQAKCFDALRDLKNQGVTLIIVSHSLGQIEQLCDRSIWILNGEIALDGIPREVHPYYLDYMGDKKKDNKPKDEKLSNEKALKSGIREREEFGNKEIVMTDIKLLDESNDERYIYKQGESFFLIVKYKRNNHNLESIDFGYNIFRNDGVDCFGTNSIICKIPPICVNDEGELSIKFKDVNLLRGKYKLDIAMHDRSGLNYHYIYSSLEFEIQSFLEEVGTNHIQTNWIIDDKKIYNG